MSEPIPSTSYLFCSGRSEEEKTSTDGQSHHHRADAEPSPQSTKLSVLLPQGPRASVRGDVFLDRPHRNRSIRLIRQKSMDMVSQKFPRGPCTITSYYVPEIPEIQESMNHSGQDVLDGNESRAVILIADK